MVGSTTGFSAINKDVFVVTTDLSGNAACNQYSCTIPLPVTFTTTFNSQTTITSQTTVITNSLVANTNIAQTNTICVYSGINELNPSINFLSVFPNPSNKNITINFDTNNSFEKIEILNVNGQIMFSENINCNIGSNKFDVDVSKYCIGIYVVKIRTKNIKLVIDK